MDEKVIDTEKMIDLAEAMRSSTLRIGSTIDSLNRKLNLLQVQWTGEASDALQNAQREWQESMTTMNDILAETGRIIDNSATKFSAFEARHLKGWTRR